MSMMNRLGNAHNYNQQVEKFKRVLCVCSAGLLRSPTTAFVLSQAPYKYNTRAAGVAQEYALIAVDQVLLEWADEIVCMEDWHAEKVQAMLKKFGYEGKTVRTLNVDDCHKFRADQLVAQIREKYDAVAFEPCKVCNEKHHPSYAPDCEKILNEIDPEGRR